jgi:hypothetical protein
MRIRGHAIPAALALLVTCVAAGPAHAVVGGERIEPHDVPWFTFVGGCGGTLVAPDRVLTAGHCVLGQSPDDLGAIGVGDEVRDVVGIAMHPAWRHANGTSNVYDDVALVQLAAPVTGVAPVALGPAATDQARIIGSGLAYAPGTGHSEAEMLSGGLRQATLRLIGDDGCARAFRGYRGSTHERFDPARMRCAIDPDGVAPLSSGCNGDSGGPLIAGTNATPVLLGVVSWGGDRCGADHLPSVFADVERYRSFITDPSPAWGPTQHASVRVTGRARVGRRLTCAVSGRPEAGTKTTYAWKRLKRWGTPTPVGRGRHYTVARADDGHRVACFAYASNDGGQVLAGTAGVLIRR